MANKHQVLERLAKGMTPQQIAAELGCDDAYVRATRRRAEVPGYAQSFPSAKARDERKVHLYRTNEQYRKAYLQAVKLRRNGLPAKFPSIAR